MPELIEVRIFAESLNKLTAGKTLLSLEFDGHSRHNKNGLKNHDELRAKLPLKILYVASRGKKIIFCLEDDIYIMSSLGILRMLAVR